MVELFIFACSSVFDIEKRVLNFTEDAELLIYDILYSDCRLENRIAESLHHIFCIFSDSRLLHNELHVIPKILSERSFISWIDRQNI